MSCVAMFLALAVYTQDEITYSGLEASRFATVQALVEHGTFAIDKSRFRSYDQVTLDGRTYSDKPLTLPLLVAGFYAIPHWLAGINFTDNYHLSIYLINLLCMNLLNVLLFYLFFRKLDRETNAPLWSKQFLSLAVIFATWLFTFGGSFNNHTPAALLLFLLFCLLDSFRRKPAWTAALGAGLTAGMLLNIEIPAGGIFGIVAFVVVGFTAGRGRIKQLAVYSCGGLALLGLMALLNYCAYGSFWPQYLLGGTYRPSVDSVRNYFSWDYCFHILFGLRGLFSYMPALLVIFILLFVDRDLQRDKVYVPVLSGVVAFIVFYAVMTNDYGSWSYGFRYLIPVIPIIWFFIAKSIVNQVRSWCYWLVAALVCWGIITSCVGAYRPWCNCFEGIYADPGRVDYYVRNSFMANVLYISFDQHPNSAFTNYLINRIYSYPVACVYLYEAANSSQNGAMLINLRKYMGENWKYIPKKAADIDIAE